MPIKPLALHPHLAPNPSKAPDYFIEIKNIKGELIKVGDPKVTRAAVCLMNLNAVTGGAAAHWGGPAALAEIMSAIHGLLFAESPWYESFNFVNDAGHTENGLYALRANLHFDGLDFQALKGFRSIESKLTGHGESHVNPEEVLLSNGPLGSALPQAQGLALADKTLGNQRLTLTVISDGACMEGEAKEALAAIPGLAKKEKMNPFVLVISDNNTKLSGRIDQDAYSMTPTFNSLENLGWKVFKLVDGHDLQEAYTLIERAVQEAKENPTQPICVWAKTIKGKGVDWTEDSASGGHGFPLKPGDDRLDDFLSQIFEGAELPGPIKEWSKELASPPSKKSPKENSLKNEKVQAGFARAAIKATQEGLPVYSLSSDLQGSTGIAAFHKEFPNHFIELGVAEANMISTAAGFSKQGLIPLVDTFAQFGVTKGNLPLTMASLSQAPVIALFSHTGFQDAADGASHQATTYLSLTSSLPDTQVVACASSQEAEAFLYQAIRKFSHERSSGKAGESTLFFVGRENYPESLGDNLSYDWGKPQIISDVGSGDLTLVTTGPMIHQALAAKDQFKKLGINPLIVHHPFVNRPDVEFFQECLERTQGILITLEDHQVMGGMGSLLTHALAQSGVKFQVRSLGVQGHFGRSAYKAQDLYQKFGLSPEKLVETYKEMFS